MCTGCGDGFCNAPETCLSCPQDCMVQCGTGGSGGTGPGGAGAGGVSIGGAGGMGGIGGTGPGGIAGAGAGGMGGIGGTGPGGIAGAGAGGMGGAGAGGVSIGGAGGMGGIGGGMGGIGASSAGVGGITTGCSPHLDVACGGPLCTPNPGCCRPGGGGAGMCVGAPTCPLAQSYLCDDASDCGGGAVCCHTLTMGGSCMPLANCVPPGGVELCFTVSAPASSCECSGTQQCCPPSAKGGGYPTCQPFGTQCK